MTRERAKDLLPIIKAYTEGKVIQYRGEVVDHWRDLTDPSFTDQWTYRIKPTPKIRPFRREEIKCGDVVRSKNSGSDFVVAAGSNTGVLIGFGWVTYEALLADYTMADGSPCGKEEEE